MEKIEYGDINKFLVSMGIVLIGLALIFPYFYLKEDFGILLTHSQIIKYEKPIQELILKKQSQVIFIQNKIYCISTLIATIGILSLLIGIFRWFKRQAKIDDKFDKEITKLELEIKSLTPTEKIEKAKREVDEIDLAANIEINQNKDINQGYLQYLKIEESLFNLFRNFKSPNFEILSQQKLGNRYYIDLILKSKSKLYSDRVVEIKYFKKNLPVSSIINSIYQLDTYISYYKKNIKKSVIPVILIVYNEKSINTDTVVIVKNEVISFSKNIPNLNRLKIEFIPEKSIENFSVKKLLLR